MTSIPGSKSLAKLAAIAKSTRLIALAVVASFMTLAFQPAQAQSSDYWKSAAIIGGATAAGAYIGHKLAGGTGTMIGAGAGAAVGYAIDARRRNGAYNNNAYAYGDPGPYAQYDPYGGNAPYGGPYNGPYDPNAGYNGPGNGPYGNGPYGGSAPYGNGSYGGNPPYGNAPYGNPYPGFQSRRGHQTVRSRSFRSGSFR